MLSKDEFKAGISIIKKGTVNAPEITANIMKLWYDTLSFIESDMWERTVQYIYLNEQFFPQPSKIIDIYLMISGKKVDVRSQVTYGINNHDANIDPILDEVVKKFGGFYDLRQLSSNNLNYVIPQIEAMYNKVFSLAKLKLVNMNYNTIIKNEMKEIEHEKN